MKKILIAGLINIETTIKVDKFPIEYSPIDYKYFGIESTIAGVGYNIAKALKILGDEPVVLSLISNDIYKDVIKDEFEKNHIETKHLKTTLKNTPQSLILYDNKGKKKNYFRLKGYSRKKI